MQRLKEKESHLSIFEIAKNLKTIESFFRVYSELNDQIANFIEENNEALYAEISSRIRTGKKTVDFGSFDFFVESAIKYVFDLKENANIQSARGKSLDKAKNAKHSVSNILAVTKTHGLSWVPLEYKRAVFYSSVAIPAMIVAFESLRASVIVMSLQKDLSEFANMIYLFYGVSSLLAAYAENKNLNSGSTIVFNPYSTLLALELSPILTCLLARGSKHIYELFAILTAISLENHTALKALNTLLAVLLTAGVWSSFDLVLNLITRNKNNDAFLVDEQS